MDDKEQVVSLTPLTVSIRLCIPFALHQLRDPFYQQSSVSHTPVKVFSCPVLHHAISFIMSPGLPQDSMEHPEDNCAMIPTLFIKMENLVRAMQHPETGIPVRSQKTFLSSVPCAFLGYDVIEWLANRLGTEDSAEALHLATLICHYGFFFPVNDAKAISLKDDSSFYRFQAPHYWPCHHQPDNTEYAIYLVKKAAKGKQKHSLEEYEQESLARLKKLLSHKWDYVIKEAEAQLSVLKDRKKSDRIVLESQERAFWQLHRPPPWLTSCLEGSPMANRRTKKKRSKEDLRLQAQILKRCLTKPRMKASQATENLIHRSEEYSCFDPLISPPQPGNPWVTDDITWWMLNEPLVEFPSQQRMRRWAISLEDLLSDPTGVREFESFLRKEYSHENLHFWRAVQELRRAASHHVPMLVAEIFQEFLVPGAPSEVNLDGKTVALTQQAMRRPSRCTFDAAQKHVFSLMKSDTYPRFLRSDHYRDLLVASPQTAHKKRLCSLGGSIKKIVPCKYRGSGGLLSNSAADLSPTGKSRWPFCGRHSHSTSDLQDLEAPVNSATTSTLSSPSGSRDHMNEMVRATLQVPRWDPRNSEEDGLQEESGLSLPVPSQGKNIIAPWDAEP